MDSWIWLVLKRKNCLKMTRSEFIRKITCSVLVEYPSTKVGSPFSAWWFGKVLWMSDWKEHLESGQRAIQIVRVCESKQRSQILRDLCWIFRGIGNKFAAHHLSLFGKHSDWQTDSKEKVKENSNLLNMERV